MHLPSMQPRASLAVDAAAMLDRSIREGALAPGARLPSEAEIARQLGVSRPVVREAIAYLKADGVVESRRGLGLFVARPDTLKLHARDLDAGGGHILEFLEFRAGMEAETARLAALRRTPADLERLEAALERLLEADRVGELGAEADLAFHLVIAEAAHSFLFPKVLRFLSAPLLEAMRYTRRADQVSEAHQVRHRHFHRLIVERIRDQDADGAWTAMRDHMNATRARFANARGATDMASEPGQPPGAKQ